MINVNNFESKLLRWTGMRWASRTLQFERGKRNGKKRIEKSATWICVAKFVSVACNVYGLFVTIVPCPQFCEIVQLEFRPICLATWWSDAYTHIFPISFSPASLFVLEFRSLTEWFTGERLVKWMILLLFVSFHSFVVVKHTAHMPGGRRHERQGHLLVVSLVRRTTNACYLTMTSNYYYPVQLLIRGICFSHRK